MRLRGGGADRNIMQSALTSVAGCNPFDNFCLPTARMEIDLGLLSTKSSSPAMPMAMTLSAAETVLMIIGFAVSVVMLRKPVDSESSTYGQASPAAKRAVSDGRHGCNSLVTITNVLYE